MAKSNPVLNELTKYLKSQFSCQGELNLSAVLDSNKSKTIFNYLEVKAALLNLKTTDPYLHSLLGYHWQTHRSRNAIASALYLDSSTLRRRWIKGLNALLNYLINYEVTAPLEPLDIIYQEMKANGTLKNA
jgi:hypothetical protein